MKKWKISLAIGVIAAALIANVGSFAAGCEEIRSNVLRVHIIANSDSPADQEIKLLIRDRILSETGELFYNAESKEDAKEKISDRLHEIEEIARAVLRENGREDIVSAQVVRMFFETREYDGFTMPAGYYDAVRITVGEAAGQNWWCVIYPSLCLPAAGEGSKLSDVLSPRAAEIAEKKPQYEVRFAIVEAFEKIKNFFS